VEQPFSERWRSHYEAAKVKRRASGRRGRSSRAHRLWRRRQRILLVGSLLAMGLLVAVFYSVLLR
jgi:hypothetical protein